MAESRYERIVSEALKLQGFVVIRNLHYKVHRENTQVPGWSDIDIIAINFGIRAVFLISCKRGGLKEDDVTKAILNLEEGERIARDFLLIPRDFRIKKVLVSRNFRKTKQHRERLHNAGIKCLSLMIFNRLIAREIFHYSGPDEYLGSLKLIAKALVPKILSTNNPEYERLMDKLKKPKIVTQIAENLGMTEIRVKKLLDDLIKYSVVEKMGKGPEKKYCLQEYIWGELSDEDLLRTLELS